MSTFLIIIVAVTVLATVLGFIRVVRPKEIINEEKRALREVIVEKSKFYLSLAASLLIDFAFIGVWLLMMSITRTLAEKINTDINFLQIMNYIFNISTVIAVSVFILGDVVKIVTRIIGKKDDYNKLESKE